MGAPRLCLATPPDVPDVENTAVLDDSPGELSKPPGKAKASKRLVAPTRKGTKQHSGGKSESTAKMDPSPPRLLEPGADVSGHDHVTGSENLALFSQRRRNKKNMRSVKSEALNEPGLSDYLLPSDKAPMAEDQKRLSRDIRRSMTSNELPPLAQALGLQRNA